jgi:glutamine amidotransferase
MIGVIQSVGGSNLASITNTLTRLGIDWVLTDDPEVIENADQVILPGVGHAAPAMKQINRAQLNSVIPRLKQPVLGICLGMQLLYDQSEEGPTQGLGIIPGKVSAIAKEDPKVRSPHMGWNRLVIDNKNCPLLKGINDGDYVYFVHSYKGGSGSMVQASTNHGGLIPAVIQQNNFYGCQFHPEKSATIGAQILKNFSELRFL